MIERFSQYLVEEEKVVYFTFGRMNPPTIGHGKLLDKLSSMAQRNPYKVFLSQTVDKKKNPLSYSDKIKSVRKMFPKHARSVMINKKVRNTMEAATLLYDQGFRKIVMVVGSDRIREFDILLNKYNGKSSRHGFYNFMDIKVVSAGDRDPDAEGATGMSASKQRDNASKNDFMAFSQGVPSTMNTQAARTMFNAVRKGMGLKEERTFLNHVALDTVSETRESFVAGELFGIGDSVIIKESDEVGTITVLGSNYVIVETAAGKRSRKWLDAVEKIEEAETYSAQKHEYGTDASAKFAKKQTPGQTERAQESQDPDIKDRPGTQPARYHKGLTKATKIARDRHFQAKKAGPAPGDANAKTKPSKHTTFVKKMMGEATKTAVDLAKARIKKEKDSDKEKHDRAMDRARLKDTRKVNMQEASFDDKSKASGISVGTLKKVYQRGVAAWKTGHRPGTTPSQWGHARVNAFISKKKKGGLNHDKDLA